MKLLGQSILRPWTNYYEETTMNSISRYCVGFALAIAPLAGIAAERPEASPSGVISSGGGKLFRYSDLPWAFKNTPEITYCLLKDRTHFSQSIDVIRQRTQDAFDHWEAIFQKSYRDSDDAGVGTQSFREVPCDREPTVTLQFGFLSKSQKAFIASPQDYVGITVPTYQDRHNLKMRGYIYIGADKGPYKMAGDIASDPWGRCDGCAITAVVFHELGHVFGFKHNLYPNLGMMDEKIPEMVVSDDEVVADWLEEGIPFFISQQSIEKTQRRVHARVETWDNELLKLPPQEDYLEIVMNPQTQHPLPVMDLKVLAGSCAGVEPGQRPSNLREVIGLARQHFSGGHNDYALRGRLPIEQTVFSDRYFEGFSIINYREISGTFNVKGGGSFTGILRFDQDSNSLKKMKDNKFATVLTWDSFFTSTSKTDRHLGCPVK